jgi:hypothetical protein
MSHLGLQAIAGTALAVCLSIGCTIEVPSILDDPGSDDGDDSGGSGGGPGGSDAVEGKLSSNGLRLAPAAMLTLGTEPLGAWVDTTTAEAAPGVVADLLGRADGAEHLEYTALCALDAGTSLLVGGVTYPGLYGFAPEWVDQPCDESCQRWVTACLLAHTNVAGYNVEISMRGEHPGMAWNGEIEQDFAIQEAGFYGNLWQRDEYSFAPAIYACVGRGLISFDAVQSSDSEVGHEYLLERMCSTGAACGLVSTGPCYFPPIEDASTCEGDAGDAGFYADCHIDPASQDSGPTYPEVVTTYLAAD